MERKPNRPTEAGFVIRLLRRLARRVPVASTAGTEPPHTPIGTDKVHDAKNGAWMESRLRGNERIWAGFREIELHMLAAETLSAVIEILARDLPAFFPGVHAVSIAWLDPDYELSRLLEQEGGTATKLPFVALRPPLSGQVPPVPALGAVDAASRQRLFPHAPQPLQSMAIVPLVLRGEQVGSLNQGSADPQHFTTDAATDLLEHLAAVTAICIDAAVNRARLRRDGLTDMLTQVANRRFFDRRMREEISQWLRRGGELSCLLVDLDYFKQINDQYGHQAGDLVLQAVARTLSKGLRTSDVLARYGGEEFVLLLPATGSVRAAEIAERLRSAVAGLVLTPARAVSLRVTASFGLASLAAEQRAALEDPGLWLLRRADQALYGAKAHGRNCVVTAPGLDAGHLPPLPVYPAASRER
jgi:two-component system cell cycle response regulator